MFVGSSQNLQFTTEGPIFEEKPTTFTIYDDGTPEPDKMYSIALKVTSGNAVVLSPSTAKVMVVGSNNPFGIFSLQHVSKERQVLKTLSHIPSKMQEMIAI